MLKLETVHAPSLILIKLFQQQICIILNVLLKRLKDLNFSDLLVGSA